MFRQPDALGLRSAPADDSDEQSDLVGQGGGSAWEFGQVATPPPKYSLVYLLINIKPSSSSQRGSHAVSLQYPLHLTG